MPGSALTVLPFLRVDLLADAQRDIHAILRQGRRQLHPGQAQPDGRARQQPEHPGDWRGHRHPSQGCPGSPTYCSTGILRTVLLHLCRDQPPACHCPEAYSVRDSWTWQPSPGTIVDACLSRSDFTAMHAERVQSSADQKRFILSTYQPAVMCAAMCDQQHLKGPVSRRVDEV